MFLPNQTTQLTAVKYFSAYATWLPEQSARHRLYVQALGAHGVEFVHGQFKIKSRWCSTCNDMLQYADLKSRIKIKHLEPALLPATLQTSDVDMIRPPEKYASPN